MSDIKINKKCVFGDDDFRVTTADLDNTDEYVAVSHDADNAVAAIGKGNEIRKFDEPIILNDEEYFDLPADIAGWAEALVADVAIYGNVTFESDNTVSLIDGTVSTFAITDTNGALCIFDNTTSVRVKNRLGTAKKIMFKCHYTETPLAPTFKVFDTLSGVDNLDPNLTINGTTVTPKFRYKLGDADATGLTPWGYGETLSRVSVATPPTYNVGSPCLGASDDSCKFNASDYYKKTSATASQFTTGDIVIEIVWKNKDATTYILSTFATNGLIIATYNLGDGCIRLTINDDDESIILGSDSSSAPADTWNYAIVFVNRDEASTDGSRWYVNGVESGAGIDFSAAEKTLTDSDIAIGAGTTGSVPTEATVAYIAAWEYANWMQAGSLGPAEWEGIAKERFYQLTGVLPEVFHKTDVVKDGDMEEVGVTEWNTSGTCTPTKDAVTYQEGTQSLKLTKASTGYGRASQSIFVIGETYRITGYARGDGTINPIITDGGGPNIFNGTTSATWQAIDVTYTPVTANFQVGSQFASAGDVWFDDLAVVAQKGFPTVATRTYPAYLDKIEGDYRKLYYVGSEWLRMCHRQDSNAENVYGYLPETPIQNKINYSEAFVTNWTLYDAGDSVNDNATVCPDGRTAAADWIPDNTDGRHELRKTVTLTAETYSFSCFVKKGAATWVELVDTALGNVYGYYNLATNTLGTVGTNSDFYVEGPFYGDFYRLCLVFTGTAASHTVVIRIADADVDLNYSTGNGSDVAISVWGAQVEASDYMTSPIITSGSALTRVKDELKYVGGENIGGEDVGEGTIVCDVLFPNFTSTEYKGVAGISDGLASADRVCILANNTAGNSRILTAASGLDSGSDVDAGTDLTDGQKHELRGTWETDNVIIYTDGVSDGAPDASADMPDDLDSLEIGSLQNAALQQDGLVSKFRIYNTPTTKG